MLTQFISGDAPERQAGGVTGAASPTKIRGFTIIEGNGGKPHGNRPPACFVRAPFSLLFKGPECPSSAPGKEAETPQDTGAPFSASPMPEPGHREGPRLRFQAVFNSPATGWRG